MPTWLHTIGAGPFVASGDAAKNPNGQPVRRYVKDAIRTGTYKHPEFGWTLTVTPERIDKWVAAFNAMQANGVKVEAPVDHSLKAEDNRGFVVGAERRGDTLYLTHELIGEDAIALAGRSQVSVWIEPDYRDGAGRRYGEAIAHSSLVQRPVVPGQGEFLPVAASGGQRPTMLFLSIADTQGTEPMLQALISMFTLPADTTDANVLDRIKTARAAESESASKALSAVKAQVEDLSGKLAKAQPKTIDPDAVEMLAEGTGAAILSLVDSAKITPAVAAKLTDALVGAAGNRNAFALSRTVSGDATPLARRIIDALKENDPVALGEKTKSQAIALSRQTPDGQKAAAFDAKEVESRAAAVRGSAPAAK
jgi:hypothetical protein